MPHSAWLMRGERRFGRRGFFAWALSRRLRFVSLLFVLVVLVGVTLALLAGGCSESGVRPSPVSSFDLPLNSGGSDQSDLVLRDLARMSEGFGRYHVVPTPVLLEELSPPPVPEAPGSVEVGVSPGSEPVFLVEDYSAFGVLSRSAAILHRRGGVRFKGSMGRWFHSQQGRSEAVRGVAGASTPSMVGYRLLPLLDPGSEWDIVRSFAGVPEAPLVDAGQSLPGSSRPLAPGWLLLRGVPLSEASFGALDLFGAPALGGPVYLVSGFVDAGEVGAPVALVGAGVPGQRWETQFVVRQDGFVLQAAEARLLSSEGLVLAWVQLSFFGHGEPTGLEAAISP